MLEHLYFCVGWFVSKSQKEFKIHLKIDLKIEKKEKTTPSPCFGPKAHSILLLGLAFSQHRSSKPFSPARRPSREPKPTPHAPFPLFPSRCHLGPACQRGDEPDSIPAAHKSRFLRDLIPLSPIKLPDLPRVPFSHLRDYSEP